MLGNKLPTGTALEMVDQHIGSDILKIINDLLSLKYEVINSEITKKNNECYYNITYVAKNNDTLNITCHSMGYKPCDKEVSAVSTASGSISKNNVNPLKENNITNLTNPINPYVNKLIELGHSGVANELMNLKQYGTLSQDEIEAINVKHFKNNGILTFLRDHANNIDGLSPKYKLVLAMYKSEYAASSIKEILNKLGIKYTINAIYNIIYISRIAKLIPPSSRQRVNDSDSDNYISTKKKVLKYLNLNYSIELIAYLLKISISGVNYHLRQLKNSGEYTNKPIKNSTRISVEEYLELTEDLSDPNTEVVSKDLLASVLSYYRIGMTYSDIAISLNITKPKVKLIVEELKKNISSI